MTSLKRNRNHALIFRSDIELVMSRKQRGDKHSGSEHARKTSGAEDSDTERRTHISYGAGCVRRLQAM